MIAKPRKATKVKKLTSEQLPELINDSTIINPSLISETEKHSTKSTKLTIAPPTFTVSLTTIQRAFEEENWGAAGVAEIQKALIDYGTYQGPIDGVPGPNTKAAYNKFQAEINATYPGQIDADSLSALGFIVTL